MKKASILFITILLLLFSNFTFSACQKTYADDLTNVKWTSSEPEMKIIVLNEGEGFGHIIDEGKKREFYFTFGLNVKFHLQLKPDGCTEENDIINRPYITGTSKYFKKDKKVVLSIGSDYIFNNKYSTITLTASDMDPNDVNPKDRYNVSWVADEVKMHFNMLQDDFKGGKGKVKVASEIKEIYFEWKQNQRFAVYLYDNKSELIQTPVLEGSYIGGGISFKVILEKNELFSPSKSEITFNSQRYVSTGIYSADI